MTFYCSRSVNVFAAMENCIAAALLRVHLEKLRNRLALAADVAVARAAHAVGAAIGPDQIGGSRACNSARTIKPLVAASGSTVKSSSPSPSSGSPICVKQRAGTIARDDLPRVVQPFHAGGSFDSKPQIAAAPRQVEREFRLVAAVNAEAGIHGVERTVEKFRAVGDDKIRRRPANSATVARCCWKNFPWACKSIPAGRAGT